MKQWYANELSKLSKVSVRALHHHDCIGLLKPSLRQSNGYRLYSEKDLLKLQQIIALKFFGFKLSEIKTLLNNNNDMIKNFSLQAKLLHEMAAALLEATSILKCITAKCSDNKSIPWEKIIELIEVYHMSQQIEHSWVKEVLNSEELKQYAKFEADLKARSSAKANAWLKKTFN
ncbi:MAG: MerR family transcriptional regulator [Gammaproteobacteria bacterium]